MRRALTLAVLLSACGGPEPAFVAAHVRIDALLRDDVTALNVFALHPNRSDNFMLTCSTLLPRVIDPEDTRVNILARDDPALTDPADRQATLTNVEAGKNRIVYVAALNVGRELVGNGCKEWITVEEGKTVDVEVVVLPVL
ncbi:MAG: hypothetical protein V3T05_13600 [Myxococcota bacterium]